MRQVIFYYSLPAMPDSMEEEWRSWFIMVGIDINDIPVGTTITCDDELRTVSFTSVVRDESGKTRLWNDHEVMKEERTIQLEAQAPLFPIETSPLSLRQRFYAELR